MNSCYQACPAKGQCGLALIALLAIIGVVGLFFFVNGLSTNQIKVERDATTIAAMKQAKDALIAWSVSRGDIVGNKRPGDLPCPDMNDDGFEEGTCSAGLIGRLPWKTLGIDDLRDGYGERLWYAVDGNFRRRWGGSPTTNKPINSDTRAILTLYGPDGTTLLTSAGNELAALIFAPGPPLLGQDRVIGPNSASNYLEAASGRNNATTGGPFIAGPVKDANGNLLLNDSVLGISARELIAAVERRVLGEAQLLLAQYTADASHLGKYPNPAPPACTTVPNPSMPNTCDTDNTLCFGRLPEDLATFPSGAPYNTPDWFRVNGWGRVLVYAVNKNSAFSGSPMECTTSLSIDSTTKNYVLIAPGTPLNSVVRPNASASLTDYLDDVANQDAWNSGSVGQPAFSTPPPSSNDQIRGLP